MKVIYRALKTRDYKVLYKDTMKKRKPEMWAVFQLQTTDVVFVLEV